MKYETCERTSPYQKKQIQLKFSLAGRTKCYIPSKKWFYIKTMLQIRQEKQNLPLKQFSQIKLNLNWIIKYNFQ